MSSSYQAAHQKKTPIAWWFWGGAPFSSKQKSMHLLQKICKNIFFYTLAFITFMRLCIYEQLSTKKKGLDKIL